MSRDPAFDTIIAPATPVGRSALAVVRIDGPLAPSILAALSGRADLEPRHATLVRLTDGAEDLDDAVALLFSAPASYTGNDLVELSLHGSAVVVERVMRAALAGGARPAEPGEFTERAVLNGKFDLVQAEAIEELVSSRTAMQARLSLVNLHGELSRGAGAVREQLLDLISRFEAALDFAEEGYEFITGDEAAAIVRRAIDETERLLGTFERGRAATEGLSAVILGQPNAGKSTLLNFLVGSDRAIVTEIPGTTRDLLRETVEIGGLPVTFTDTAGLRETSDTIERIGVIRAREAAAAAQLVLYLIDASRGVDAVDERELATLGAVVIRVYTKTDLRTQPPGELGVSVRMGGGVEALLDELDRRVRETYAPPEATAALVNQRQRTAVAEAREALQAALVAIGEEQNEELVLVDLYRAANSMASLTGAITTDEVLREIFSKFCIGK